MEYWLQLRQPNPWGGMDKVRINFGDNQGSRGAVLAGLGGRKSYLGHYGHVEIQAWDIDEKGKRWEKGVGNVSL